MTVYLVWVRIHVIDHDCLIDIFSSEEKAREKAKEEQNKVSVDSLEYYVSTCRVKD